jgi:hypothetical protein
MSNLKPWARGPFELIRHAEDHLRQGSDFDKRMALISYDNAIETAIDTFLGLKPIQRAGVELEREKRDKWRHNYHTKLEFLEHYVTSKGLVMEVSRDEVVWCHDLRNQLYHSGNGMVPEEHSIQKARDAALWVFSVLFEVDARFLLSSSTPPPVPIVQRDLPEPPEMRYLQLYAQLVNYLIKHAWLAGLQLSATRPTDTWRLVSQRRSIADTNGVEKSLRGIEETRNAIVSGAQIRVSEDEFRAFRDTFYRLERLLESSKPRTIQLAANNTRSEGLTQLDPTRTTTDESEPSLPLSGRYSFADRSLPPVAQDAIQTMYLETRRRASYIDFGSGLRRSINPKFSDLGTRSPYTLFSDGELRLNFSTLEREGHYSFVKDFRSLLPIRLRSSSWDQPRISVHRWHDQIEEFFSAFDIARENAQSDRPISR